MANQDCTRTTFSVLQGDYRRALEISQEQGEMTEEEAQEFVDDTLTRWYNVLNREAVQRGSSTYRMADIANELLARISPEWADAALKGISTREIPQITELSLEEGIGAILDEFLGEYSTTTGAHMVGKEIIGEITPPGVGVDSLPSKNYSGPEELTAETYCLLRKAQDMFGAKKTRRDSYN